MEGVEIVRVEETYLMGSSIRTSSKAELAGTGKIPILWESFRNFIVHKIPNKPTPSVTLATYSDYENKDQGLYTLTVGIKVDAPVEPSPGLVLRKIPAGQYAKLSSRRGPLPAILLETWVQIWSLTQEQLGGERAFSCDFELYDERAVDSKMAIVDFYLSLKV